MKWTVVTRMLPLSALRLGPKPGRILLAVLSLALIPVVIFAWAFEIAPEGIEKEEYVVQDESITNVTASKLNYITGAAALATASALKT